jgi:hypothetical protein
VSRAQAAKEGGAMGIFKASTRGFGTSFEYFVFALLWFGDQFLFFNFFFFSCDR